MIVLSCFDGMSCGQIAFERAGINVSKYYASEIDKYAIQVTQKNYPNTIQLGDIKNWRSWNIEQPDIVIGGSPCQGFSFAGKRLNFDDPRSKLFFTFAEILKHYKPKHFLLENVLMDKRSEYVISEILGDIFPSDATQLLFNSVIEPIKINSALVSAQNRRRLYWTNIQGIEQPKDKGILLKDILESDSTEKEKSYCLCSNYSKVGLGSDADLKNYFEKSRAQLIKCGAFRGRNPENPTSRQAGLETEQRLEIRSDEKTNTLTSVQKDNVLCMQIGEADIKGNDQIKNVVVKQLPHGTNKGFEKQLNKMPCITTSSYEFNNLIQSGVSWRKLTPVECERLQTVPDNYTNCVSNTQRYKMLGNGWTVDVIAHIFKNLKKDTG